MPHSLDAQINQLFRERDELTEKEEDGTFIEGTGWVGTSPRYLQILGELLVLTRQRMRNFHICNPTKEI